MTAFAGVASRHRGAAPVAAAAALAAGCLAIALVDPSGGPTVCPFRAVTGLDCPGCGATRAAHHLLRGDVGTAVGYNLLFVLAVPFLAWAAFAGLTAALGGPRWPTIRVRGRWVWAGAAVAGSFWLLRNLPMAPLEALGT